MYNTIIRQLYEPDTPHIALQLFVEMRRRIPLQLPDSFSFAFLLKVVANSRCFSGGTQIHCQSLRFGLDRHLYVGTTLISMYGECKCLQAARKVFDEMYEPNVVARNAVITACFRSGDVNEAGKMFDLVRFKNLTSWNVMLAGYMKVGEVQLAREKFFEMPIKDDVSWSTIIVGSAQNGCFNEAFECFRELMRAGFRPNEVSLTGVLSACAQAGAFENGKILHGFIGKILHEFIGKIYACVTVTLQEIKDQERFDGYYHNQFMVVNDCLHRYKFMAKWMFLFDVDEYIYVPKSTLKSVLNSLEGFNQFTIEQRPMNGKTCLDSSDYGKAHRSFAHGCLQ